LVFLFYFFFFIIIVIVMVIDIIIIIDNNIINVIVIIIITMIMVNIHPGAAEIFCQHISGEHAMETCLSSIRHGRESGPVRESHALTGKDE
jgi:hypothetical protein